MWTGAALTAGVEAVWGRVMERVPELRPVVVRVAPGSWFGSGEYLRVDPGGVVFDSGVAWHGLVLSDGLFGLSRADVGAAVLHGAAHCVAYDRCLGSTVRDGRHTEVFRSVARELGLLTFWHDRYGWLSLYGDGAAGLVAGLGSVDVPVSSGRGVF